MSRRFIAKMSIAITVAVLISLTGLRASLAADADAEGFVSLFDGKTLDGWKAPDPSYWSVEDGAITAKSTAEHPCKVNQFIVWQPEKPGDFELRVKFRIEGPDVSNSGVQIRSKLREDGHVVGYQVDIDRAGKWLASIYGEATPRGQLAKCGEKVTIAADGKRTATPIGDAKELLKAFHKDDWNEYHIIAQGTHITVQLNGQTTAELVDDDAKQHDLSGVIALQLHSGPPMRVQFKDIRLKHLTADSTR